MKRRLPQRAILALALLSLVATAGATRAEEGLGEYRLKGAFLYHFFSFVEWPEASLREPTLCVVGDDPFGAALDELAGKVVRGKALAVVRVSTGDPPPASCSILFVARSEAYRWRSIARGLSAGTLTVSDIERFAQDGGVIEMYLQNRKVRLAVNQANARAAGLSISSRLLALAERVDE